MTGTSVVKVKEKLFSGTVPGNRFLFNPFRVTAPIK